MPGCAQLDGSVGSAIGRRSDKRPGALLPFFARRIGTDSATLSSPLITSVMDVISVFIYFGFAHAFLGDLLAQSAG